MILVSSGIRSYFENKKFKILTEGKATSIICEKCMPKGWENEN